MLPKIAGEFRVGSDPDLRFAPSGVAVGSFRAVASRRKKNDDGEWVDDKTIWVKVICFKQLAENVVESVTKGDLVEVRGDVQVDEWETKEGEKRTNVEIIADSVAPSLARATAKVNKIQRTGATSSGATGTSTPEPDPGGDPWVTSEPKGDEPPF